MDLTKLKKGEMFDYLNNNGTKSRKRFNGLCIDCKIKEVEDSNNIRCNACISCEGLGVPAAMVNMDKNGNTIKSQIKCSFDDCNDIVLKNGPCKICKLRTIKEYKNDDGIEVWTEPKIGSKWIGVGGGIYIWYGKCIDFEKYNCRDSKTKYSNYCRNHKRKFKN
jgi:hypothetical protein